MSGSTAAGFEEFYAHAAKTALQAHAAQITNSQVGLLARIRRAWQEGPLSGKQGQIL